MPDADPLTAAIQARDERRRLTSRRARLRDELAAARQDVADANRRLLAGSATGRPASLLDQLTAGESGAGATPEARAAWTDATDRRDRLQDELARQDGALADEAIADADERLARALDDQEAEVRRTDPGRTADLDRAAADLAAATAARAATARAAAAAATAETRLTAAARQTASASDWSTWDTVFGGGLVSTAMKYERLHQARGPLQEATAALDVLRDELSALAVAAPVPVEIGGVTQFFDRWLDNLFTDWSVHRRIRDLDDRVRRARLETERARHLLVAHAVRVERPEREAADRREELLLRG